VPAPYTALTYGDPPVGNPVITTYNVVYQDYPWWLGTTIFGPGTQYNAYSQSFSAGGLCPQTMTVQSGALPTGLALTDVGTIPGELFQIAGTPSVAGTFTFTLRASNTTYRSGDAMYFSNYMDRQFSITIAPANLGGGCYTFVS